MTNKKEDKKHKMIKGYLYNAILLILFIIGNLFFIENKPIINKKFIISFLFIIISLLLIPSLNILIITICGIINLIDFFRP